ncbi:hypothetical protein LPAF129_04280 [Ligilactobacillus pabuli]|uniref:Uncharacterized protein n=1 Tax=Ligilactobacillus pabuli TaxID=2886039 RepID=A0ABQ5JFW3_9LACO|nr:hypothetical protein [Ligilactobacillus pabuli]GKS80743.1 hypothetical protein LPAF129_04280 [Ligilactobacillus pabuli]
MQNILDRYLNSKSTVRYRISKKENISASTLQSAADAFDKDGMNAKVAVKTITAIAHYLHKTPGQVLDGIKEFIEKGEKTLAYAIEFTADDQTYSTSFEMEPLTDDNVQYVDNVGDVGVALVDIFKTHDGLIDGDKDQDDGFEAYYSEKDMLSDDNVRAWFLKLIEHSYPDAEITEFTNETEFLNK